MKNHIKFLVVVGPESTGKSALSAGLAAHYQTLWVPEHARAYLEKWGTDYSFETLREIGHGQYFLENGFAHALRQAANSRIEAAECSYPAHAAQLPRRDLLVADTDQLVMQVWAEFVFGRSHNELMELRTRELSEPRFYLLCAPDLPWTYDPLREYPDGDARDRLFWQYKALLEDSGQPFGIVEGVGEKRLAKAISLSDEWLAELVA